MENRKSRRDFLKLLAGFGLGASAAEIYERLYNIPSLEKNFTVEISHWMRQYEEANQSLSNLQGTVSSMDALEKESVSAISSYQEKMQEAMEGLRRTLERYSAILGEDRVEFESHALKVLEDLKMTREKLEKLSKYFPLTKSLSYEPTRIINDKICDLNVSFDVISPLNTLSEVEVSLIPIEYKHLPREAFPQEEIRVVKLQPRGLEREIFSADFVDLKGGREYLLKTVAKDVADNIKETETKTPYVREFGNIAPLDDILVITPYYVEYRPVHWQMGHKYMPLLGEYWSNDSIVHPKHIDWATGHGIDAFIVAWLGYEGDLKYFDDNLKLLFRNELINDIKVGILYESHGRLKHTGNPLAPWEINLTDPENIKRLSNDFEYLAKNYFNKEQFLKINSAPFIYLWDSPAFIGNVKMVIEEVRKKVKELGVYDVFLVSDFIKSFNETLPDNKEWAERAKPYDGITSWLGGVMRESEYLGGSYENQLEIMYSAWDDWTIENKKKLLPYAAPEYVDIAVLQGADPAFYGYIPYFRGLWEKRIEILLKYSKNSAMILVGSFNDFGESHCLESSKEYSFERLEVLKTKLKE